MRIDDNSESLESLFLNVSDFAKHFLMINTMTANKIDTTATTITMMIQVCDNGADSDGVSCVFPVGRIAIELVLLVVLIVLRDVID